MHRIKGLDYLRGLAALSIMFYHFMKWTYVYEGANSFIGRLSVYGVEIFYILSGITLFHVYQTNLNFGKTSLINYFTKRFFRIFPLFWLCVALTLLLALKRIAFYKLLINVSGVFSFLAWDKYIASGTWSIGNELVFYFSFPLLLFLYHHKRIYFNLIGIILLLVYHYFAYYVFNPNDSLHNQWTNFVNPLNHLFLFYVGMLIPAFFQKKPSSNLLAFSLIFLGYIMLFLMPIGNDGIHLLYGINRWIFSTGAILICMGCYHAKFNLPVLLDSSLKQLGEISYSLYLLHPLAYKLLCIIVRKLQIYFVIPKSNGLLIACATIMSITISKLVYKYFEVYFIKKGAKITANFYKS